ncbi:hypothetical protein ACFLXQ_02780 [Chloroflexota bacterium]
MCCETESHRGGRHSGHHHGCRCGCCGCGCGHSRFGRTFWTKDEKIAWLEEYLEDVQAEAKAVEERIAALKKEQ